MTKYLIRLFHASYHSLLKLGYVAMLTIVLLAALSIDLSPDRDQSGAHLLSAEATQIGHEDGAANEKDSSPQPEKGLTITEADKGTNAFATDVFSKEDILADRSNRVPEIFHIPEEFEKRVSFWFDVYTKYGSNIQIFHHAEYPWIVFKTIDTTPVWLKPSKTRNPWAPYHRVEKFIKDERKKTALALVSLAKKAKKKKYKLTREEAALAEKLKALPGPRAAVYKFAAENFRSQMGQRDFYKNGLINSSKYLGRMEETFARYDLPVELTRLPLVESSFNEKAISKVGASGIWQFMPSIGRSFLRVGDSVDERNSPLKATEAASRLFLQNFRIFKSWPLAITAYNHGAGGLLKATRSIHSNDLGVLIRKYKSASFQFASKNFYSNFLAALHAERYQNEIFGQLLKIPPLLSDTIKLQSKIKAANLADVAGITMEELRLYNPDLKMKNKQGGFVLPKGYNLHLPEGRAPRIELYQLQAKDSVRDRDRKSKSGSEKSKRVTLNFERLDKSSPSLIKKRVVVDFSSNDFETVSPGESDASTNSGMTEAGILMPDAVSPSSGHQIN